MVAEQRQVERSERALMLASALLLALVLASALVSALVSVLAQARALVSLPMLMPKLASKPVLTLERSEAPAGLFEGPQQLEAEALAAHRLRAQRQSDSRHLDSSNQQKE